MEAGGGEEVGSLADGVLTTRLLCPASSQTCWCQGGRRGRGSEGKLGPHSRGRIAGETFASIHPATVWMGHDGFTACLQILPHSSHGGVGSLSPPLESGLASAMPMPLSPQNAVGVTLPGP